MIAPGEALRRSVRGGLLRPLRGAGLGLACHWPFPVAVLVQRRRFYVDLRSGIGRGIYMTSRFDPAVFGPIEAALWPGAIFVDVGANIGWYSFSAAHLVGPTGCVRAFEVDRRPLRCLRRTCAANPDLRIEIHELAVGDRVGTATLRLGEDCGHTSLSGGEPGPIVSVTTLDTALLGSKPIAAVKIDVEGAELRVLRGARRLLAEHRPVIVCEVVEAALQHFGDTVSGLTEYLHSLGYVTSSLAGAWTPTIVARPVPGDEACHG